MASVGAWARHREDAPERLVTIGYKPRQFQREIHEGMRTHRFGLIVAHRRFGKTVCSVNEVIRELCEHPLPDPRGFYFAPFHRQAKTVAWDFSRQFTSGLNPRKINENELRVDFLGDRRLQLLGTDNVDAVRGVYADIAVLDEFAQMNPRAWPEVIRPALADRHGKALIKGTPLGKNAFYQLYESVKDDPEWFVRVYRASETGVVDEAELASARKRMSEDQYAQEFECSFAAGIAGAYYAKLLEEAEKDDRIGRVPVDPLSPVHTVWDLGMRDDTSIWFFQKGARNQIGIIDYYEHSGVQLNHYVQVLRAKGTPREGGGLGYNLGKHFVPHDAKARDLKTGEDLVSFGRKLGIQFHVLERIPNVNFRIEAVRNLIPRCFFDALRCKKGFEALRGYRRARNERTGEPLDYPLHSWESDAADAFGGIPQALPFLDAAGWQKLKYDLRAYV